jgi:hypothetical protein
MRFVVFHHIRGSDSRRLAPGEIHLSVYGAERQPRFENQQHAAVKKKTCSSQTNYHRHQVVVPLLNLSSVAASGSSSLDDRFD